MQVRQLPRGGQLSIHGNVVNVPADVNSTVSVLPTPINESQTIPIKLKRLLGYKHQYQFQNVGPSKVLEAAQYLQVNYLKTKENKLFSYLELSNQNGEKLNNIAPKCQNIRIFLFPSLLLS